MQAMNVARGSRVWDLLPRDWRPNPRLLITSIPIAVFYLLTVVASPSVAVAGGFIAAAIVFYYTRHSRLYQALSAVGFAVVTLSAAIGIIWSREKAYLAAGPASDFLFVWIYAGSVVIRQPLVGGITREVFPRLAGSLPVTASVFVWLMISWAVFDIFSGALRVYLLSNLSVGEYIIWETLGDGSFNFFCEIVCPAAEYFHETGPCEGVWLIPGEEGDLEENGEFSYFSPDETNNVEVCMFNGFAAAETCNEDEDVEANGPTVGLEGQYRLVPLWPWTIEIDEL